MGHCLLALCQMGVRENQKEKKVRKEAFFQEEKESKVRPHMFLGQPLLPSCADWKMWHPRCSTHTAAWRTSVEVAIFSCRFYFRSWNIKQVKMSSWMQLVSRVLHLQCEGHTCLGGISGKHALYIGGSVVLCVCFLLPHIMGNLRNNPNTC